jgi:hypothetical protein
VWTTRDGGGLPTFPTGVPFTLPDAGRSNPDATRPATPTLDAAPQAGLPRADAAAPAPSMSRVCRPEAAACQSHFDCCGALTCQRGRCTRTCGDGVCGADETPESCCKDCGRCGAGTYCSQATLACSAPVVLMSFTFTHACMTEPGPIGVRFFDESNSLAYPSATDRYTLPKDGTETFTILCVPGARICYGAAALGGRAAWGTGLQAERPCVGCCATCGTGDVMGNLVCR